MMGPVHLGTADRRWIPRLTVALVVAAVIAVGGYVPRVSAGATEVLGPGVVTVTMDVRYSRFDPALIRVRPGTTVRFVVENRDPIHHELIVGPPEVHEEHASGDHLEHPPVPGEVSIPPHATGTTFYRFDEPGTVLFACHLPGHYAYGMVGSVEVTAG